MGCGRVETLIVSERRESGNFEEEGLEARSRKQPRLCFSCPISLLAGLNRRRVGRAYRRILTSSSGGEFDGRMIYLNYVLNMDDAYPTEQMEISFIRSWRLERLNLDATLPATSIFIFGLLDYNHYFNVTCTQHLTLGSCLASSVRVFLNAAISQRNRVSILKEAYRYLFYRGLPCLLVKTESGNRRSWDRIRVLTNRPYLCYGGA
ncbi:unnamed protein product, partial [Nesidiocoris tenuis]